MPPFVNLAGQRIGRWIVIRESGRLHGGATWLCRCDCGNEKVVRGSTLRRGESRSCGCLNLEIRSAIGKASKRHGKTGGKLWNTWVQIRQRCENPNFGGFKKYGAKGIKVCERWHCFESFAADIGEPPTSKHTIDRIDSKGNYEPGNCRWATQIEQQNNRSTNRIINAFGKSQTLQKWVRETGYTHKTITGRIDKLGWSAEAALSTRPIRGRNQYS